MKKLGIILSILLLTGCFNEKKIVEEKKYQTKEYKAISLEQNNLRIISKNGKIGIYNEKLNKESLLSNYDYIILGQDFLYANKNGKYGILNSKGEEILACEFDGIKELGEELFAVKKGDKVALMDSKKEQLTDYLYDNIMKVNEERLIVINNKKYGVISKNGNEILSPEYLYIGNYENGLAQAQNDKKFGGYIDKDGIYINKEAYDYAFPFFNNYGIVIIGEKYGLVNNSGDKVIAPIYDGLRHLSENIYIAKLLNEEKKSEYIVINLENNSISDEKFDGVVKADKNIALVVKDKKIGLMDLNNFNIKMTEFDEIGDFISNVAITYKNGKYGLINKSGEVVVDFKYDYITARNKEYFIVGNEEAKEGIVNKTGNQIIEFEYDKIQILSENSFLAYKDDGVCTYIVVGEKGIYKQDIKLVDIINYDDNEIIYKDNENINIIKQI